ncbi:hypothetical protein [Paenibacillus lautus]|uniref:hypothetical protein n=1 Tax=Paenibacillus lautus TaxID=1401 RepID=UPI002DBD6199|nr:hypothetical protein [Paenibacillus lautus]MEC0256309.1 hypothetical protein [Paenibacillus lautus]
MKKISMVLLFISFIVMGCVSKTDSIDMPLYEGRSLVIGVIGETPQVREEGHVDFKEVTFEQLEELDLSPELDAVFITKERIFTTIESLHNDGGM